MFMSSQPKYLSGLPLVLLTMALSLAVFMEVLDTTIANVALPHIAGDLGAATSQGTWVITSFAVANAISVPLTGWVARRFGEVRLFLTAVLMFVITSWLCGIAHNLTALILFRTLQGLFTGPLIPLSQSLLLAAYPPHRRHLALAFWGMTVITAPILGPIIGGYISDRVQWGWIFFINVPIGILAFLLARHFLNGRETQTERHPIDTVGLVLMVLGVGSLQFVLDHGREVDWFSSNLIVAMSVVAVVALSYFIVWELGTQNPIVDLHLFKERNFTVGTLCLSLAFFLYMGTVMLLPMLLQTQLGYTATWSGLAVAPVGIMPVLLAPIGTFFLPLSAITLAGMEGSRIASASSLSNFTRVLAGAVGSSVAITLWEKREAFHHARLAENFTPFSQQTAMLQSLQETGISSAQSYGIAATQITQQGFIISAAELFYVSSGLFLFLIILVWQAKPPFGAPSGGH